MSTQAQATESSLPEGPWITLRDIFLLLRPASFSILVALIAIPVFLYVDQGVEIVRGLGEGNQYNGKLEPSKLFWLAAACIVWSLNTWYWARVNLNLRTSRSLTEKRLKQQAFAWIVHYGPRILGVAPPVIIATAFAVEAFSYSGAAGNVSSRRLLIYSGVSLLIALLLYAFFVTRRRWLEKRGVKCVWRHPGEYRSSSVGRLPKGTLTTVLVMVGFAAAVFLTFLGSPITAPKAMGSAAIIALGGAFWVCFGSFLIALGNSIHFPVISALVLLAVASSCLNDNHAVRLLNRTVINRVSPTEALKKWKADVAQKFPAERRHPLFIVAAEGGGVRAAYWTATVLGTIQERAFEANVDFASHVFAISGVSGGSLGAAVFEAELVEGQKPEALGSAQDMLGEDFLSPALAALVYRDFLQRFLPAKINSWDRGRALEMAWEDGWRQKVNPLSNRFERGLNDIFPSGSTTILPALFLNATSVEAGRRVIVSNVHFNPTAGQLPDLIDAVDAVSELDGKDMRLSTAAHLSARFTYVSPAGLFPDGQHVVDGGYFENSGEATVIDLLRLIASNPDERVIPIVIEIRNAPGSLDRPTTIPKAAGEFLSDLMSPVYALLHTRDARGTYSQVSVRGIQIQRTPVEVLSFGLLRRDVPLPLGWMLSGGAAREMKAQIEAGTANYEMVDNIVDRLIAQ